MTDQQLLEHYLNHHPEAFSTIVERHLPLVYHTAMRQVGAANAEDVTQIVFALLSQRIKELTDRTTLAGWLHEATRYCCRNYIRAEYRRRKHESEAAMHNEWTPTESHTPDPDLKELLDDALGRLNPREREAVLLRYLENRSIEETAAALAIAPAAAAKRAIRGLNKLRVLLGKKGVAVPLATLGAVLAAQSAHAVPAGLQMAAAVAPGSSNFANAAATLGHGVHYGGTALTASMVKIAAAIALVGGIGFAVVAVNQPEAPVAKPTLAMPIIAPEPALSTIPPMDSAQANVAASVKEEIPIEAATDKNAAEKLMNELRRMARDNNRRGLRSMLLATDEAESLLADGITMGMIQTESMLTTAERQFSPEEVRRELYPGAFFLRPVTERQWVITSDLTPTLEYSLATQMVWQSNHWMIDVRSKSHGGILPDDMRGINAHVSNVLRATHLAHEDLGANRVHSPRELAATIQKYGAANLAGR